MPASTPATTLADRAVLRVSGDDPRGFLQGLVTNDMSGALPVWAGLLSAQGKALFDFIIWPDGSDLLIDCEAGQADALANRLTLYRLRRALTIARDEAVAVHWAREGASPDPRLVALGHRWLAPPGVPASGWREHRLSLGVTEGVVELGSGETLWLECNAAELNGVSFTKGCYVGQENTARMNWRAKVNRRLIVQPMAEADAARTRATYPELGLAVVFARAETIDPRAAPHWLATALSNIDNTSVLS